ncbi:MAG: vWA domain-containing protein [Clostridia bacterium]|nr:vWA domain-containing protein [Clostridia bacterium]
MAIINGMDLRDATVRDVIHMFFLLDNSGSMGGAPIQTLNEAMVNVLSEVAATAMKKEVTVMVHALSFSGGVRWLCGTTAEHGVDAANIVWNDITTEGNTNTALAIRSILPGLSRRLLGHYAYRPIIVLITDAYSDNRNETMAAIDELINRQKTIRVAVGVSGYKADELNDFASTGTVKKMDDLGNEEASTEQKLIFPVDQAEELAGVITDVAVSSLISSMITKQVEHGETPEKLKEENPEDIVITLTPHAPTADEEEDGDDKSWIM